MLQEVEQVQSGGQQIQPPPNFEYLKKALPDYQSVFVYPPQDARELPFGFGLAIFSRFPILGSKSTTLPGAPLMFEFEGEKTSPTDRILLTAEIDVNGKLIHFLNTHLQAYFMINASSDDYPQQREIVLEQSMSFEGPVVLTGDFNSAPNEQLVTSYEASGLRTMQKDSVTWKRMPYVLDHIFFNNHLVLKGGTVDEVLSSDHHLLVADFEV
jgi:endonuclease/exonuclease/phosphatase (EEP) superfamily protein YafD